MGRKISFTQAGLMQLEAYNSLKIRAMLMTKLFCFHAPTQPHSAIHLFALSHLHHWQNSASLLDLIVLPVQLLLLHDVTTLLSFCVAFNFCPQHISQLSPYFICKFSKTESNSSLITLSGKTILSTI